MIIQSSHCPKTQKYHIPIWHLQQLGWNLPPRIIHTACICGIIHQSTIDLLTNFNIPHYKFKNLMETISCSAIKYLTCSVLNKLKFEKYQALVALQ